jgi:sugar phosphate isomerase/epimerase
MAQGWTRRGALKGMLAALPAAGFLGGAAKLWGALPFKLGIITDEITQDFSQALEFISSYSLEYCELREIWNKNIMNLSGDELSRTRDLIQKHHLQVSDIGSPVMKYNLPQMPARAEKRDTFHADFTDVDTEKLLEKAFELARFFRTRKIRVFSYWRVDAPEKAYPYVRDRLAKAAEIARQNSMLLVLENEHECNIGTGNELGRVLKDVNSPHLQGNWDPGNAAMLGEVPYPDGYRYVRDWFAHVHVKDVKKDTKTGKLVWAPVGGGFIDWRGQLEALRLDGYEGTMSLETHYRRPDGNTIESTRESLQGLLKILRHESMPG